MYWDIAEKELKKIKITSNGKNELVSVNTNSDTLECVGVGTDAAVFRFINNQKYAYKVFSDDKVDKIKLESAVYLKLGHSEYYPEFFGNGSNFLVISHEEGITLYDCLLKGIHIPKKIINDVDNARKHAFEKGLNPRDIHLKNIIFNEGRAKIIDVSEYMKPGNDKRWEYLKEGYHEYYHLIDGKALPHWIIETVRKWYNQSHSESFKVQDFVKELALLFRIKGSNFHNTLNSQG
ncbi:MAG: serine/threonine protein kinase [Desulfobulbaceae bacterium]|nr:serine/threonine protein kinase [Desulfobulbaceae bacterium]